MVSAAGKFSSKKVVKLWGPTKSEGLLDSYMNEFLSPRVLS